LTRIRKDETDVSSLVDLLENDWINPFQQDPLDLISLSTGTAASKEVSQDLLSAKQKGEVAYLNFQVQRLQQGEGFYDTIKRLNLKTFNNMKKAKTIKGTKTEIVLKADRRVFGNMLLIAQSRKMDMLDVLSHPLGPIPWALANPSGTMKTTGKSVFGNHLEGKVHPAEAITEPHATIIDAMALIRKAHGENHTFEELSDKLLTQILYTGQKSNRIDVVFDVYREQSIKTAERECRASQSGIVFTQIRPGHTIRNWKGLLDCTESKNNLTKFLAENWQNPGKRLKLGNKVMFITCGNQCLKLTKSMCQTIGELGSDHEEADTRVLLHAKHAAEEFNSIEVVSDDTDVLVICLALSHLIDSQIYIRRGTKLRVRLVDIGKLSCVLGDGVRNALPALHAWTGCDTISALAGQGKLNAFKLITQNQRYQVAFTELGSTWQLSDTVFDTIEEFTCKLYSRNTKCVNVNKLRYEMYRSHGGDVESGQLPPCQNTLYQHTLRANYQSAIWKKSLQNSPCIPNPYDGHGWTLNEGNLEIQWMTSLPAPEIVLSLMACKCSRACKPEDCPCIISGLKCTAACKLQTCSNMVNEEEVEMEQDPEDSDSDDD
jgi:hypothetical protein